MKETKYICNLCRESVQKEKIIAFYFKCDIIPQQYILDKNKIDECDKHICENCISIIVNHSIASLNK